MAVKPIRDAKGEARVTILVEHDDGSPANDIDVVVHADRGAVRADKGVWGKQARARTVNGEAIVSFTSRPEFVASPTPGTATLAILTGPVGSPTDLDQLQIQVVGEPMLLTIAAAPSRPKPGELVTVTAIVQDAVGNEVVDGTPVEFSVTPEGELEESVMSTRRGRCTTYLLTRGAGPYTIVAATNGISATARIVTTQASSTVA